MTSEAQISRPFTYANILTNTVDTPDIITSIQDPTDSILENNSEGTWETVEKKQIKRKEKIEEKKEKKREKGDDKRNSSSHSRKRPVALQYTVETPDQSILTTEYVPEARPYGQMELEQQRKTLYFKLNLSNQWVHHHKCGHTYYVKQYGQKYKEVIESKTNINVGNCSVCWKLRRMPRHLRDPSEYFTEEYGNVFKFRQDHNDELTYDDMQIERIFYTWLYLEQYENKRR